MMRFGSVCSGIEAASAAWLRFRWQCQFMSEIEDFPRAVLKHHYPDVPLHGDFTTIQEGDYEPIDLLVGGTPCQSFSVAGLRGGMADVRGNLALEYLRLADRLRPAWLVWENVPGVLSSNGGRDFGSFLGGMAKLGYGFAYRVLDAQYCGLAQRRKRVFVVGHLGDWRRAAAVLFEPASLRWDTPPRRETGEDAARCLAQGSVGGQRYDGESETFVALTAPNQGHDLEYRQDGTSNALLTPNGGRAGIGCGAVAIPLLEIGKGSSSRGEGPNGAGFGSDGDPMFTLQAGAQHGVMAFDARQSDCIQYGDKSGPFDTDGHTIGLYTSASVRRLTPRECERLQGFSEQKKFAILAQCYCDRQKSAALAEIANPKSPLSAWIAGDLKSALLAKNAGAISSIPLLGHALPVALHVLIDLEREAVRISKAGRLLWSASAADVRNLSRPLMPIADFVRLAALLTRAWEPETQDGRAVSQPSMLRSIPLLSGSGFALLSGPQTKGFASDALRLTKEVSRFTTSTTSQAGQDIQTSESAWETLSSCVLVAIGSFIPQEIQSESSYALLIETTVGYTAITYRGKPAADGPRYRALGNSMAVPVMAWIGQRIASQHAASLTASA